MKRATVRLVATLVVAAWWSAAAGCHSFGPPRPATLQRVSAMPLSQQLPAERFVLEIESPSLAGVFDVLCAIRDESIRLQLFPDMGGKVLDCTIEATRISAQMPGHDYQAEAPFAAARPHLALLLAAMLVELRTPVVPSRVIGEQVQADGTVLLQLQPALGSGTVVAELEAAGSIHCYRMQLGWLQFDLFADGRFCGRDLCGRLCP